MTAKECLETATGHSFPYVSDEVPERDLSLLKARDRESYDKVMYFKEMAKKIFSV